MVKKEWSADQFRGGWWKRNDRLISLGVDGEKMWELAEWGGGGADQFKGGGWKSNDLLTSYGVDGEKKDWSDQFRGGWWKKNDRLTSLGVGGWKRNDLLTSLGVDGEKRIDLTSLGVDGEKMWGLAGWGGEGADQFRGGWWKKMDLLTSLGVDGEKMWGLAGWGGGGVEQRGRPASFWSTAAVSVNPAHSQPQHIHTDNAHKTLLITSHLTTYTYFIYRPASLTASMA